MSPWQEVEPFLPVIWDGFFVTVKLTAAGFGLALPVALVLGTARRSQRRTVRAFAGALIEFFRGTSVIVQLFWAFYALPLVLPDLQLQPFFAATMVLALNVGSYGAEIVRGGVAGVPAGQVDAAVALNLSPWNRFRRVVMPQALPSMLPPFGNLAIDTLKATAVVGFITVEDLTYWIEQTRTATGESLTVYGIALLGYFTLALIIAVSFRALEAALPLRRIERRANRAESQNRLSGSLGMARRALARRGSA